MEMDTPVMPVQCIILSAYVMAKPSPAQNLKINPWKRIFLLETIIFEVPGYMLKC